MPLNIRIASLGNIPKFIRLIWKTSRSLTIANMVLRAFKALVPICTLYVTKLIIDEVSMLSQTGPDKNIDHITLLVFIEFGLVLSSNLLSRGITLLDTLLGDLVSNATSVQLMEHCAVLDLEQFEDDTFHDKLERARTNTYNRVSLMSNIFAQVQDLIAVILISISVAGFNYWLILLLILSIIPNLMGESHFNNLSYALTHSQASIRRELDYVRRVGACNETAKEVKVYGLSVLLVDRFKSLADQLYSSTHRISRLRAAWGSLLSSLSSIGYYIIYAIIVMRTITGEFSIGDMTFLIGSFIRLREVVEQGFSRFVGISQGALFLQDLFDFLRLQPVISRKKNPRPFPRPITTGFEFRNVGFKYQNADTWAVRNINLCLPAGKKIALVGENGCGKTTLTKLLSGLYEPTEGQILLDGYDLREYDPHALREEIGVIFQDFNKYHFSAAKNISFGNVRRLNDLPMIKRSAELSLASGFIERLPGGYDQMIGRTFKGGVDLSGGQWQRIALGRAYMRDAQLFILDEPTAALDAKAEQEIFNYFNKFVLDKTAVIISHRFSTIRKADIIVILKDGAVLELGSHQELMMTSSRYAELFNLQAQAYQ